MPLASFALTSAPACEQQLRDLDVVVARGIEQRRHAAGRRLAAAAVGRHAAAHDADAEAETRHGVRRDEGGRLARPSSPRWDSRRARAARRRYPHGLRARRTSARSGRSALSRASTSAPCLSSSSTTGSTPTSAARISRRLAAWVRLVGVGARPSAAASTIAALPLAMARLSGLTPRSVSAVGDRRPPSAAAARRRGRRRARASAAPACRRRRGALGSAPRFSSACIASQRRRSWRRRRARRSPAAAQRRASMQQTAMP